jgi:hypothetical protein
MNDRLFDALEVCLEALETGIPLESCLQLYPDLANYLRPELEAALAARSLAVETIPADVMNRNRTRLLGRAAQLRVKKDPHFVRPRVSRIAFSALLIVLLVFLTSGSLLIVSAKSLPGDSLYPFKQVVETLHVRLAPSKEQKQAIEQVYQQQHIEEVQQLIVLGRIQKASFEGVVDEISPGQWIVGGIPLTVSSQTTIIGQIEIGRLIEVEGITQPEGWVEAHEIHLREYEFYGQAEFMDTSQWIISGISLQITSDTQIGPGIQLKDSVLVLVRSEDDGFLYALAILSTEQTPSIDIVSPTATVTPLSKDTPNPISTSTLQKEENGSSDASKTEEVSSDDSSGDGQDAEVGSDTGSDHADDGDEGKAQITSTPEPDDKGDGATSTPENEHEQNPSSTQEEKHDENETPDARETDHATPTPDE